MGGLSSYVEADLKTHGEQNRSRISQGVVSWIIIDLAASIGLMGLVVNPNQSLHNGE